MSAQGNERRKGLNRPVVWFFILAAACVIAFLIVGLVKTCNADHEDKRIEEEIQQQELGLVQPTESLQLFA